jgi:hypothetical protein
MPTVEAQRAAGRRLFVETDADEPCPLDFEGDSDIVLFFASWAYTVQFGGMHELARAALHLQRKHKVNLRPILRYADRQIDDEADERELERAWQPAAELATCCRAVVAALEAGDPALDDLVEGYETLGPRLAELASICDWAAERGARVRLSFDMSHGEPTAPRPELHEHGPLLGPLRREPGNG